MSNKITNPLARLTKKKKKRKQITSIRNETEGITTNPVDIKRIIKEYYKQLYTHQFDNLGKIDHVLGKEITPTHLI